MQKPAIHNRNNEFLDKRQKVVAGLYLATAHISDNEPFRQAIRSAALELHAPHIDRVVAVEHLTNLLRSAAIAKVMSESNVAILVRELAPIAQTGEETAALGTLFAGAPQQLSRTLKVSFNPHVTASSGTQEEQNSNKNESKNKRQEQILSFINGRKSAVIKDISALFPEVSEKTIQRELGTLVDTGKITKRGSKRWSVYMAV